MGAEAKPVRPWAWPVMGGPARPPAPRPAPGPLPRGPAAPPASASGSPHSPGPRVVLRRTRPPMAGKVRSLLPPLLLAAAGLAGLLLLCVPTRDVREPPALKVRARAPSARLGSSGPGLEPGRGCGLGT